jgi:hypothetical protein
MARIPVEKKSSNKSWLWLLLILLLVGLLIWWLLAANDDDEVVVEDTLAIEQTDPIVTDTTGMMTIAAILANPSQYYGRDGFTANVGVAGPLTDRGFWITDDQGNRMLAIIIDQPREVPLDINPGQQLSITDGTIRNPAEVETLPGVALDNDTIDAMEGQQAVLVVDEDNIEILDAA